MREGISRMAYYYIVTRRRLGGRVVVSTKISCIVIKKKLTAFLNWPEELSYEVFNTAQAN